MIATQEQIADASEYRTIDRYPGYRFGADGSAWTSLRRQGSWEYRPSSQWRRMKPSLNTDGYLLLSLRRDTGHIDHSLTVHSLVIEAFRGPCPSGCEVRHFPDGTRSNNAIANLIYGTRSDNFRDKWDQGTMPHGESHPLTTLSELQVRDIRSRKASGESLGSLAVSFGVCKSTVSNIVNGRTWQWLK